MGLSSLNGAWEFQASLNWKVDPIRTLILAHPTLVVDGVLNSVVGIYQTLSSRAYSRITHPKILFCIY